MNSGDEIWCGPHVNVLVRVNVNVPVARVMLAKGKVWKARLKEVLKLLYPPPHLLPTTNLARIP